MKNYQEYKAAIDCIKYPRKCMKKGVNLGKEMHKNLGGGIKGAAALAGIGATAAFVPGGAVISPLLYKGAKKILNPKMKFKEYVKINYPKTILSYE